MKEKNQQESSKGLDVVVVSVPTMTKNERSNERLRQATERGRDVRYNRIEYRLKCLSRYGTPRL